MSRSKQANYALLFIPRICWLIAVLSGVGHQGMICFNARLSGPIAQRLEQGTHNPLVPGSNPGGPSLRTDIEVTMENGRTRVIRNE